MIDQNCIPTFTDLENEKEKIFVSTSTFTDFHWLASCTKQFIIDDSERSVDPLFASFTLITPPNMTFHVMLPPQQENDQICGNTAYYGLASDII